MTTRSVRHSLSSGYSQASPLPALPASTTATRAHGPRAASADRPDSLCDVEVATRGCGVEGRPALVVLPIHVGPALHQEPHHVEVLVDAGLRREARRSRGRPAGSPAVPMAPGCPARAPCPGHDLEALGPEGTPASCPRVRGAAVGQVDTLAYAAHSRARGACHGETRTAQNPRPPRKSPPRGPARAGLPTP